LVIGQGRTGRDSQPSPGEVTTVVAQGEAKGATDLSRAAQQPGFRAAAAAGPHLFDATQRF
jgi:hypothetical protein